jgi:hypothetical protein
MDWEGIWDSMSSQADMDTAQEECDRQLESEMRFSLLMEDTLDDKASCQPTNLMFVQDDECETSPTNDEFTDAEETRNLMSPEVNMDAAKEEYLRQPPVVEMRSSPFADCTTEIGPSFLQSNPLYVLKDRSQPSYIKQEPMEVEDTWEALWLQTKTVAAGQTSTRASLDRGSP